MTDEARIARLAELARRIWNNEEETNPAVSLGLRGCDPNAAYVVNDTGVVLTIAAPNDRALDALEAALQVLAGESAADDVITLATKLNGGPMRARMMQLASEWEKLASTLSENGEAALANAWRGAVRELRERARQP